MCCVEQEQEDGSHTVSEPPRHSITPSVWLDAFLFVLLISFSSLVKTNKIYSTDLRVRRQVWSRFVENNDDDVNVMLCFDVGGSTACFLGFEECGRSIWIHSGRPIIRYCKKSDIQCKLRVQNDEKFFLLLLAHSSLLRYVCTRLSQTQNRKIKQQQQQTHHTFIKINP